ncbi:MAG: site-specific DNA-methyltransferase [Rhodobacteraceae bacterium]|nr:site-specific DNA-methyltransferase [Paracoccaceae bacterium]
MKEEGTSMEKLDGEGMNIVEHNIGKLKELFPEVFSEGKINFEQLKELLGEYLVEDEDHYNFKWYGKRKAGRLAQTPSLGTLRPCKEESVYWDTTQNLFIEGENLEVLKLLQKSYHRQVKMIYIDPPYNTGNDFVYKDNFKDGINHYLEMTGQLDSKGKKMGTNSSTAGRYHTNWLNMMYPRLKLARNLLRDDGVIIISIDDNESENLKKISDEIFGEDNFIGCVMWNSTKSVTNTAIISVGHTYNLVYARRRDYFKVNRHHFRLPEDGDGFSNPDNDPKGPWKADPFQVGGWRPNQQYEIINPNNGKVYFPNDGCSWKNDHSRFKELMEEGRIIFGLTGDGGPQRKRYLSEAENRGKVSKTWWDDLGTTTSGTQSVKDLFEGKSVFSNPKPIDLISRFIELGDHTNKGIVLDFFSGSSTTGHSVYQLNVNKGAIRKLLLVQLPENIDENDQDNLQAIEFCKQKKIPLKISEISKERLRRAAKKIQLENPDYKGDLGFKVFKLDSSNIKRWEADFNTLEQDLLNAIENIKQDRTNEDILFELLLKQGLKLTVQIETLTIKGKTVYSIGLGALVVCLEEDISMDVVNGIGALKEELEPEIMRVVFKDDCFRDDVVKTNALQTLKRYGIDDIKSF